MVIIATLHYQKLGTHRLCLLYIIYRHYVLRTSYCRRTYFYIHTMYLPRHHHDFPFIIYHSKVASSNLLVRLRRRLLLRLNHSLLHHRQRRDGCAVLWAAV